MSSLRKNRHAFRPTVGNASLEERVVLSQATVGSIMAAAKNPVGDLTARQLSRSFMTQNRAAFNNLHQTLTQEARQLFANGRPTSQQLQDFNATAQGQINALAFQLSSQQSLLPGNSSRLVTNLQNSLLGSRPNSLISRIQNITSSNQLTSSPQRLLNAITNSTFSTFQGNNSQLGNLLTSTNFARASVDQSGNRIPLQQFLTQRIVNQFGSTLGGLQSSFNNIANNSLFANGATPSASDITNFQRQFAQGTNLAAFQLANNLNLLPGASSTLLPQLQSGLFGSGTTSTDPNAFNGLFNGIQNLPFSGGLNSDFTTGVNNTFNNAFANVGNQLGSFVNLPNMTNPSIPAFSSIFSPTFTNANAFSGFNNGFGSGFPGFGTAPTGFNSNFGNGFNNAITTANNNFGFTQPSILTTPSGGFNPVGGGATTF